MTKHSAGILLFRRFRNGIEVLLVHPGGPFWAAKDEAAWSIPKGEYSEPEDALAAAKRELREETGIIASDNFIDLGIFKQPSGKIISAWAVERNFDPKDLTSNTCSIEWPPNSGHIATFPEVDRAAWFSVEQAETKIIKGQGTILRALLKKIGAKE